MKVTIIFSIAIHLFLYSQLSFAAGINKVKEGLHYPGAEWEFKSPDELGLDAEKLDQLAITLGGRGCIVKDGYMVKTWGSQSESGDWLSSAKPVLSTLLFFAIKEGKVKSVDSLVSDWGWDLQAKDKTMTFRHLASMTSGYARPEKPGEAWAYNDFGIQLYQKTLFDRVFRQPPEEVITDPGRLGFIHFQDTISFSPQNRRMSASVRDFARIGLFWLNSGYWNGTQLLPRKFFDDYMKPQTPKDLPHTAKAETNDYLGIGTYGGGSDHFTDYGSGTYGFNWWFNDTGRLHPDTLSWPDAPADTFMSIGAGGNCCAIFPSLGIVVSCARGNWGNLELGNSNAHMNKLLKLVTEAGSPSAIYGQKQANENKELSVLGLFRKWRRVTLTFDGPDADETGNPNPFLDYRLNVTIWNDNKKYAAPGYFAADGNAGETSATRGNKWRVHFTPDEEGLWYYKASFRAGKDIAASFDPNAGTPIYFDGVEGSFLIGPATGNKRGFYTKGMLRYTGERYLQFAENGEYYLKGGADSPENFLAYYEFDQTPPTHKYEPHTGDWEQGDPIWKGEKGKNIIGALNYLASTGMNSIYFLTMNVTGDGKDVWPWINEDERYRFDCSKLDQWEIVFSHMDNIGLMLHVVLQEQENDQLLDGGALGIQRILYFRELIARFSHHLAIVWNLGEENTNSDDERKSFCEYFEHVDPYNHPLVVHTFPGQYDKVYEPLIGFEYLEGPSLQLGDQKGVHAETIKWVNKSASSGHQWFVCLDEIGPPDAGVKPDADDLWHDEVRNYSLWGNLMAGGSGCEWYFGYKFAHNDLNCEDWRSRENMWALTRHALNFFHGYLPFTKMKSADDMTTNPDDYCFAKADEIYAIYLPEGGSTEIYIPGDSRFNVWWYNPRTGSDLQAGTKKSVSGPGWISIGMPPKDVEKDWVVLVKGENL